MQHRPLGRTGISVSRICMGTMTMGEQSDEAESFALLDQCVDGGVNFFDTAEMYAVPARAETQGASEAILGKWMAERGNRDKVVVATKVSGPGESFNHVRGGNLGFRPDQIEEAIEQSLRRLRTDYIDLYQLHWPERDTNYFGRLGYTHPENDDWTPFEDVLATLGRLVDAGKVRAVGCSNETPWGVMKMLALADAHGLPRMASIQNPYSLLNRVFEVGLAEVAMREDCGLLAYSPLAFGVLSGKYLGGQKPPKARLTLFPQYGRYVKPRGIAATETYVALARKHGLDPAQMALAYVNGREFLTSNIIGATTPEQLASNLASDDLVLSDEVLADIESVHDSDPNPAP
ncbi:MAG: aldo/keto reductase [Rhodospirillales bacterium]